VEFHTGRYANAWLLPEREGRQEQVRLALKAILGGVQAGLDAGLIVHGGHGLTYANIAPVAAIRGFTEFNIGHSIISRAIFVGLREAVAEMKRRIDAAAPS